MKTLLFVMLFGFISAMGFADITLVQKVETGPMMGQPAHSDTMTWAIKGSKARIDFSFRKTSQIVDLIAHKLYRIDADKKQVMVISTDLPKESADIVSQVASETKVDIRKTGKTETIDGYKCEEYLMTMSGPMSMTASFWITQDIDAKEFEPFRSFGMQLPKFEGSESLSEMKGIPIKSTSKTTLMGKVIDGSTEMQSISHDAVSASLFEIPKDYKVMDMSSRTVHKPQP